MLGWEIILSLLLRERLQRSHLDRLSSFSTISDLMLRPELIDSLEVDDATCAASWFCGIPSLRKFSPSEFDLLNIDISGVLLSGLSSFLS